DTRLDVEGALTVAGERDRRIGDYRRGGFGRVEVPVVDTPEAVRCDVSGRDEGIRRRGVDRDDKGEASGNNRRQLRVTGDKVLHIVGSPNRMDTGITGPVF